jgi:hypothetical protein
MTINEADSSSALAGPTVGRRTRRINEVRHGCPDLNHSDLSEQPWIAKFSVRGQLGIQIWTAEARLSTIRAGRQAQKVRMPSIEGG